MGSVDGLNINLPVGAINGSANVSASGAAVYSIPIMVPVGNKDMVPQLAISYSSQSGNGSLGIGWNLNGLSSMTATGKNLYYDGIKTPVSTVDSACRLTWDGKRLFGRNNPGLASDTFDTEVLSNTIIKKTGSGNNSSFKVETPDGKTLIYGGTENSRMHLNSSLEWRWLLEKVYNRNGDTIRYTYSSDNDKKQIILSKIEYGGNRSDPINEIFFHYKSRVDINCAYILDNLIVSDLILDSISVLSNNEFYGAYSFNYDTTSGNSLLRKVTQYDSENNKYNPTKINWNLPDFNVSATPSNQTIQSGSNYIYYTGDFTGDGYSDLVSVRVDKINRIYKYYLYKGSASGLNVTTYDETGDLPRSYTAELWDYITDYHDNYCGATSSATYNRNDVSHILSGDFDGDGIHELLVKVNEWDILEQYLPAHLNGGPMDSYLFESGFFDNICNLTNELSDQTNLYLNYGIARLVNFDESQYALARHHSFRLGYHSYYEKQYGPFPDLAGYGYNCFPESDSLYYYDPVQDTAIAFCRISGDNHRWGEFNGDGLTDYIEINASNFQVYRYNHQTNNYTNIKTVSDHVFLGTIDLNGDGISGWIAMSDEDIEQVSYLTLWNEFCTTCNIMSGEWDDFLTQYNLEHRYSSYCIHMCGGSDDYDCRMGFLNNEGFQINHGRELYIEHIDGRGPKVVLEEGIMNYYKYTRAIAVDINSDGYSDLCLFNEDSLKRVYYNFKSAFSSGEIEYSYSYQDINFPYSSSTEIGDFNGDGIIELLCPIRNKLLHFVNNGINSKQVSGITNGLGIQSRFYYKPITNNTAYTNGNNAEYPIMDFIAPFYVVTEISTDNGVAATDSTRYKYEGAKIHLQGKGFLGFMKSSQENLLHGTYNSTVSSFDTVFFETFPISTLQKLNSETVKQTSINTKTHQIEGKRYTILTNSISETEYLNNITTTRIKRYNSIFQPVEEVTRVGSDSVKTKYTFTSAGWHYPYLPAAIVQEYYRNSLMTDSISYQYNAQGNLIKKTDFAGTEMEKITRFKSYDNFGNPHVITSIGKMGKGQGLDSVTIVNNYSTCGRFIISKKGPLNQNMYYDYNLSIGRLTSKTSVNNLSTFYEYGPFQVQETNITPDSLQQYSKLYWAEGHSDAPSGALFYKWECTSGTPAVQTFYDPSGRKLRVVSVGFDSEKIYTDLIYDSKGRIWKQSMPYFSTGTPIPIYTVTTYDNFNRVIEEIAPDNTKTEIVYGPLQRTITVSKGSTSQSTTKTYNSYGELVQSTDNLGNSVYNTYYSNGLLKESYTSVNPTNKTSFAYNEQGKRIRITDPDAGTISSVYDSFGNLVLQVNGKNDSTSIEYDKLGRTIKTTDTRGDINFVFNADTTSSSFSQTDSVYSTTGSLSETYTYDNTYGRLISSSKRMPGRTFTNSYTYDQLGRPETRTYPSGFEIRYTYTDNGDLDMIYNDTTEIWSCNETNPLGQITAYSQGTYNTSVTFNSYGQLNRVATNSVSDMRYVFDDSGNLLSREDYITSQKEVFTYDDLNRLTKIIYFLNGSYKGGDLNISYSTSGNIISKTGVASSLKYGEGTAGPHALTTIETPYPAYKPPPQFITYTNFNKVNTIQDTIDQDTTFTLAFTYGLNNQRVKTVLTRNSSVERTRYFDGDYEEYSTSTGIKKYHYINAPTGLIGIFVSEGSADTLYHVLTDHLSSLNGVINAGTDEVTYYSYSAWGIPRDPDDWTSEFDGALFGGRGYTGHEHLEAFDLINMNGRVYDPVLGRFLSPDPYVQAPGYVNSYNRYAYCLNNPLVYTDPDGEFFIGAIITTIFELGKAIVKSTAVPYFYTLFTGDTRGGGQMFEDAWSDFDPFNPGTNTNKAWKIDIGGFQTDENKSSGGRTWELISRWTWQLPQTLVGKVGAHGANNLGLVNEVNYFHGATVLNTKIGSGGMTLGSFIFGKNLNPTYKDHLFVHEYGHYLQGQKWGLLYLPLIGIPSIQSAILQTSNPKSPRHRDRWFEAGASRNAGRYFDEYYGSGLASYVKGSPDYFDLNSFINSGRKNTSPYRNPRVGTYDPFNYSGHPIEGKFHWSDPLLHLYLASLLFLF